MTKRTLYQRIGDENFKTLVKNDSEDKESVSYKADKHINQTILKAFRDKPR